MKALNHTIILGFLISFACAKTDNRELATTIDTVQDDKLEFVETKEEIKNNEILSIQDTTILPRPSDNYPANIITTGQFHSDEVWDNIEADVWFGLFSKVGQYYIEKTTILTNRVNDPILDDESDETGWDIATSTKDTSLVLISGLDFATIRKVDYVDLVKQEIFPGDTVKFKFLNAEYELFATGIKEQQSDGYVQYSNYKLYIKIKSADKNVTQLLVAQPAFDDEMIDIMFSGDIDGDGILDLLINTSNHYNAFRPTLYLSKPSDKENVLKVVGRHTSVGC